MKKGEQYINVKSVQAAAVSLAKKLADAPDRDDTTSRAFLWGAAALAYSCGGYDTYDFDEVLNEVYAYYDYFVKKRAVV